MSKIKPVKPKIKNSKEVVDFKELELKKQELQKSLNQVVNQINKIEDQKYEKEKAAFLATPEYKKIESLAYKLNNFEDSEFSITKEFNIKFGLKVKFTDAYACTHLNIISCSHDFELYFNKEEIEDSSFCEEIYKFCPDNLASVDFSKHLICIEDAMELDEYVEECKAASVALSKLKNSLDKVEFNVKFKIIYNYDSDGVLYRDNIQIKVLDVGNAIKPKLFKAAIESNFTTDFINFDDEIDYVQEPKDNPNVKAKKALQDELKATIVKIKESPMSKAAEDIIYHLELECCY